MKSQILLAILPVALAGPHVNYYDDTKCGNWIGQKDLQTGMDDQKVYAPANARSAVAVDTLSKYHIFYFKTSDEKGTEVQHDGCWWSDQTFGFKVENW
ncbi:hypothetical protein F5B20DRAFT_577504 [Whalleya microplaca]|nr:hypothetical protein F5B20DRAFT_577504 [Whalleya microplaca]